MDDRRVEILLYRKQPVQPRTTKTTSFSSPWSNIKLFMLYDMYSKQPSQQKNNLKIN